MEAKKVAQKAANLDERMVDKLVEHLVVKMVSLWADQTVENWVGCLVEWKVAYSAENLVDSLAAH